MAEKCSPHHQEITQLNPDDATMARKSKIGPALWVGVIARSFSSCQ